MSSTYSPSLRIELIGAGEQAGTWNTTTNTNLGTLIESAIAGYVTVSVTSANQAFTALDGAADQARNAVIELTTTTTANFAVYAPPQEKTYIVYNTTAYTATIYNSTVLGNTTAAGLGVAITPGGKSTVFSDATNFRGTAAGDLTGAVTSVGNVTSLGSFTSAQLAGALTDETGTGANVFASSPTLTTPTLTTPTMTAPILGTPTSGTLDNCTSNTEAFGTSNTQLATTAFVQAALQALHPVGSVYINATNATNPGTLLGFGTWSAFGAGRVPVGFNASNTLFDTAEETGGSADAIVVSHSHTATVSDPGHLHNIGGAFTDTGSRGGTYLNSELTQNTSTAVTGISVSNSTAGSSGTNANYQPYITVYMWKRTA